MGYVFLDIDVATPCGIFKGVEKNELAACAVSIIRAGDSMLQVPVNLTEKSYDFNHLGFWIPRP